MGKRIREILRRKGHSVVWFCRQVPCSRSNAYRIFLMESMNSGLLTRISKILDHDFFKDVSDELLSEIKDPDRD